MTASIAVAPVKVLIVDDSAVVRQVLSSVLADDPRLDVIATASDPLVARRRMQNEWPDVIVLDVEMPHMDGITFLRQLMAERPTPVVICSTLTEKGAATTMQALSAGAVAFFTKPTLGLREFLQTQGPEFRRVLVESAACRPKATLSGGAGTRSSTAAAVARAGAGAGVVDGVAAAAAGPAGAGGPAHPGAGAMLRTTERIVAIGASTGGTQALREVLLGLPRTCPGIVVVQHMPERFTAMLAEQLGQVCAMEVREAADGDRLHQGLVLIAPGGRQMALVRHGAFYRVQVVDAPPVNRHRPSVDVLFRSVAENAGRNALGILLTGMGADGARGLLAMRQAGADTVAQDEASCVVFGMPREAIALDAACSVLGLGAVAEHIGRFQLAGR